MCLIVWLSVCLSTCVRIKIALEHKLSPIWAGIYPGILQAIAVIWHPLNPLTHMKAKAWLKLMTS